jgi:CHASE1-domain containing sensor protein
MPTFISLPSVAMLFALVLTVIAATLAFHVALDTQAKQSRAAAARIARAKVRAREFRRLMRGSRARAS